MRRISLLFSCLWLSLCLPLMAQGNPEPPGQSDCKKLISHSGFAEFVMPSEGGKQKLPIKASPSAKWAIQNNDYVEWIEILDGSSGTGPGTTTIQLGANTGKSCRVGVLTITGVQSFYGSPIRVGSPIRILQRGTESASVQEPPKASLPSVIDLAPFSSKDPQTPGKPKSVFIKK